MFGQLVNNYSSLSGVLFLEPQCNLEILTLFDNLRYFLKYFKESHNNTLSWYKKGHAKRDSIQRAGLFDCIVIRNIFTQ